MYVSQKWLSVCLCVYLFSEDQKYTCMLQSILYLCTWPIILRATVFSSKYHARECHAWLCLSGYCVPIKRLRYASGFICKVKWPVKYYSFLHPTYNQCSTCSQEYLDHLENRLLCLLHIGAVVHDDSTWACHNDLLAGCELNHLTIWRDNALKRRFKH